MEKYMKTCLKNEHLRRATSSSVQGTASRPVMSQLRVREISSGEGREERGTRLYSFRGHCGYLKISILEIFCPVI